MKHTTIKLMTYNIGGGRKDLGSVATGILETIQQERPDILALQEAISIVTENNVENTLTEISSNIRYNHFFFGQTLSMEQNLSVNKYLFVYGIFNDWKDWQQGNALLSQWPFIRLNALSAGTPRNIPIYSPNYEGNRDTEPRYVILARVNHPTTPFYVLTTHLTTLLGERGGEKREIPLITEKAKMLRYVQCRQIITLINKHLLEKEQLVFLMGDFNAEVDEPCIQELLKNGFFHLSPEEKVGTHIKRQDEPVDHIFVYPGKNLIKYRCQIIKNKMNASNIEAFGPSDHLPVVAEVNIYDQNTEEYKLNGSGVQKDSST